MNHLDGLSFVDYVVLDAALIGVAVDMAISFGLRGADAFYVAVVYQLHIPLVTFDREQLTRPTMLITTIRP